jgi:hypothetical protein
MSLDEDTGGDADADSDSDADVDSDSDTDSDSDSDGDSDTWPNGDTAPDGYGDVIEACWLVKIGGESDWEGGENISKMIAFLDGSSVVGGNFPVEITLGQGEPNETTLVAENEYDPFMVRFDADGYLVWAVKLDGAMNEDDYHCVNIDDLAAAPDGGFAMVGELKGTAVFGEGEPNETILTPYGNADVFLARYAADGTLVWARNDGGLGNLQGSKIAVLANGSFVVTGGVDEVVTFGLGEEHETTVDPGPTDSARFVARFYSDGLLAWAHTLCDNCGNQGTITAHPTVGMFYVGGHYQEQTAVGIDLPNETTLVSAGLGETADWVEPCGLFIAAYGMDEQLLWVATMEGNRADGGQPENIAFFDDGSFVIGGTFNADLGFDVGGPNETILHATHDTVDFVTAMFAARFTEDGEFVWALGSESGLGNLATYISAVGLSGERFAITGMFKGAVNFGLGEPADTWLVSASEFEPFAAVYTGEGDLEWVARTATGWDEGGMTHSAGLADDTMLMAGIFKGTTEFLIGDDLWESVDSIGGHDGYLLHVCP